tara:strand:- start:2110 stop:2271 length:162 start_codon:yes stop_codon:yes gene_type:complete
MNYNDCQKRGLSRLKKNQYKEAIKDLKISKRLDSEFSLTKNILDFIESKYPSR